MKYFYNELILFEIDCYRLVVGHWVEYILIKALLGGW